MQILVVGSETHVCNAMECIIAVQGHFRVNQGHWFWYQSKARVLFPISDQFWYQSKARVLYYNTLSYLPPFRRYGGLLVENRQFVPTPPSFNALAWGEPLRILGWSWYPPKLEWWGYHMVKKSWTYVELCGQSARVWQTDGQMDGRTELRSQRPCNA